MKDQTDTNEILEIRPSDEIIPFIESNEKKIQINH